MVAILYNVRSLHNVGSIFRTSDAAGMEKLFLCGYTPAPVDKHNRPESRLVKTALGAEKYVKWEKVSGRTAGTVKLINQLKKEGYKVLAVEQSKASVPFHKVKYKNKQFNRLALVMGNEVKGLPPSVLKAVDMTIEIPMFGKKESLNVSVAYGIAVYEIVTSWLGR
ncbi:MAG: TrmH family RNA methyltransferase [Patescibacteria group bacterium]|nr:TrmH family RNA methyltransferase [Patescibacteria group bacterium]